jgi:hypothetical protein
MRHIPIEQLANLAEIKEFEKLAEMHLEKLEKMNDAERKDFMRTHTDWNSLQPIFYKLSSSKCWYSEAPPGAGDYEIDHFRPKNRSKQYDGSILHEHGYWWLAYNWRNLRLAGGLINKLRKDRLSSDGEVKGKGDYFPIDVTNGGSLAHRGDNLQNELNILLDPTIEYDVSLITFDKNGEPIVPAGLGILDEFRVVKSIFFYHLDLEQLNYYRSQVWKACEDMLGEIDNTLRQHANEHVRREILRLACKRLGELTNKEAPYSMTAWACIEANSETYSSWLKNLKKAFYQK